MKKIANIAMLTLISVLMLATTAIAAPYYHGDFGTNTVGCGQCHVTHAGSAKALLISGPTQTDFCYYCHSGFLKSPYDVVLGKIQTATETWPSVAGGFEKTFNFDTVDYSAANGLVGTNYGATTSMHGVETKDADDWVGGVQIPGGSTNLVGAFRCGSCHDPHAGGAYDGTSKMPRLMRRDLPTGVDFDPATFADWTFTATTDSSGGGFKASVVTGYGDDTGTWCAGCHDVFNQTAHDAGQTAEGTTGKYMHRMNFTVQANGIAYLDNTGTTKNGVKDYNVIQYMPLSKTSNELTCLTCHRAHGTSALVTGSPSFNRAAAYQDSAAGGTVTKIASTVLLRLKDRDVCYNCHGAAVANTPALQVP